MKYIIRIVLLVFIIINMHYKNVYSIKSNGISFQNISIEDGLSQSLAEYIYQDSYGYIWIATNDGLNRYNGSEFKIYKNIKNDKNSISNNSISCILEDDNKNLWVGTYGGLNKINLATGEITRYLDSEEDKSTSNNVVDELLIDSSGRLWVATMEGVNIYDEKNDKFTKILSDYLKNTYVQDICQDYMDRVWIATRDGLFMYDENSDRVTSFLHDINKENTISGNDIFSIYADKTNLWIGTKNSGLNVMNLQDYTIKTYSHNPEDKNSIPSNLIRDIMRDSQGRLWLATDQGLSHFNEENETFITYVASPTQNSITDNNIINLFEDKLGTVWVGTFNGISRFSSNNKFTIYRNEAENINSISHSSVCGIHEDDESNVWVGTFNSGINKIDKVNNTVTRYYSDINDKNSLSSNRIKDITGIDNEIWIATDIGLNKFDKITGKFTTYKKNSTENSLVNDEVRTLYVDKEGLLWIGTRDGICTFDRVDTFVSYNEILEANGVYQKTFSAIYEDSEGIMWFALGNDGGLVKYDKGTGEVKNYLSDENDLNSLSSNTIRTISEDSKGNLWLGTQSGLNKFNKEKEEFTVYSYSDGLTNDYIYGILVDSDDNIWCSTNYGISVYNQIEDRFTRYYEADGLSTNEFNGFSYHKGKSGSMYFGGINGLTEFNPFEIKSNSVNTNVIIDNIKTSGGIEIPVSDNIILDYHSRELYIKFFIPEYKNISQLQYAYRLEGLDKEWTFSGAENYVRYASLAPGKYKLQIVGRNYNGNWSDISEISIEVRNPPWKTPFAYVIYISIIVIIIYLIWNEMKILDALVVQRTQELNDKLEENKELYKRIIEIEKYKNNYFVNLSHELRTPLNVILSIEQLITSLRNTGAKISDEKMATYMTTLKGNSKRLLHLINNIIDTSKIESGTYKLNKENVDIVSLVEDTALSMVELAEVKKISLIVDPEIEEKFITCDKLDIERCIINLIGNAIKFTEPGGSITVTLSEQENNINIRVKDTGIGMDSKYFNKIFDRFGQIDQEESREFKGSGLGLTLTKNLINLHGGDITVISEKGIGSEFIITLPIN